MYMEGIKNRNITLHKMKVIGYYSIHKSYYYKAKSWPLLLYYDKIMLLKYYVILNYLRRHIWIKFLFLL